MKARHISKRAAAILDRLRSHRHVSSTNEFAVEYMQRSRILPFVVRSRKQACCGKPVASRRRMS